MKHQQKTVTTPKNFHPINTSIIFTHSDRYVQVKNQKSKVKS
ncbi:hypothetical protein [Okeania sp. SIO3B5]|nr:hypothetical protein [Okeania sp. SIO3B5]